MGCNELDNGALYAISTPASITDHDTNTKNVSKKYRIYSRCLNINTHDYISVP